MGGRVIGRPWAVVASDLMEFPQSKGQYKYVVVFQDLFTRSVELRPLRAATGKNVAKGFEKLVLFRWGTSDYLLTDNGKEFDNKDLGRILKVYGVTRVTTPPYHPQAKPIERSNRTLKKMIATFVKSDHQSWDQLHELRDAMNTAAQSSTRVSPAFLNYGRHPPPVKSLRREIEKKGPKIPITEKIWVDRVRRLDALRDLVIKNIEGAHQRQANHYNKGRRDVRYVLPGGARKFSAKLILALFQEMSRMTGSRTPSPVARALSPAMTLSPLLSLPVSGSHANWLEQELLLTRVLLLIF